MSLRRFLDAANPATVLTSGDAGTAPVRPLRADRPWCLASGRHAQHQSLGRVAHARGARPTTTSTTLASLSDLERRFGHVAGGDAGWANAAASARRAITAWSGRRGSRRSVPPRGP